MKNLKEIICFVIMVMMILSLSGCKESRAGREIIDYADAESFEAALNKGENLEGKIVQFVAGEMKLDPTFGYNVWAGEHLNFVSSRHPDVKAGDAMVVKTATIQYVSNSWIIKYEKAEHAVMGDATITWNYVAMNNGSTDPSDHGGMKDPAGASQQAGPDEPIDASEHAPIDDPLGATGQGTTETFIETSSPTDMEDSTESSVPIDTENSAEGSGHAGEDSAIPSGSANIGNSSGSIEQPLELVDSGWYISSQSDDIVYVDFCGMIYNPNKEIIAEFPKITATAKSGDGSILATDKQTGSIVMPGDTIILCHMFSMPVSGLTDDMQIIFDVDCSEWVKSASFHPPVRTTDFVITNVTERNGKKHSFVTGEITNNYSEDIDSVNLSMVFKKDGKIVYMDNIFPEDLKSGKAKAFEFEWYREWPEHDTIDISALVW